MKIETKFFKRENAGTLYGFNIEDRFVGSFGTKNAPLGVELLELSDWDKRHYADIELKDGEKLFRLSSDTMRISGQKPLVKVNLDRCLVYYMDRDEEPVTFESRGVQMTFLNLIQD